MTRPGVSRTSTNALERAVAISRVSMEMASQGRWSRRKDQPKPVRVLLVDDYEAYREAVAILLSGHGFTVDEASNGADALTLARTNAPDIAIVDVCLPDMDGINVASPLPSVAPTLRGCIALTGLPPATVKARTDQVGCLALLTKPCDVDMLAQLVHRYTRPFGIRVA